jgi:hypothetical protein
LTFAENVSIVAKKLLGFVIFLWNHLSFMRSIFIDKLYETKL